MALGTPREVTPKWMEEAINHHEFHVRGLVGWLKRYQNANAEHSEAVVEMLGDMIGEKPSVAWAIWRKYGGK